ncbi:Pvc16 family protein [Streptomyces lavendulae]|uniref:Pvc16 family protein n=1 Tax=Streptomyces lavendulae TaxID=1914 RepID=UPI0033D56767
MSIVQQIDDALERQLLQGPLRGINAQVSFDPPTADWAARRSGPCLNAFLYGLEEDLSQRQSGELSVIDEQGVVIGYDRPSRFFTLGYALTVWGDNPRDEHRMLGTLLEWAVATDHLVPNPSSRSTGLLALNLRENHTGTESPAAKIWLGLGPAARPILDLLVTVPVTGPGTPVTTEPVSGLALRAARLDPPLSEERPRRPPRPRGTARPHRYIEEIG